jgi:hypothetical protein
MAWRAAAAGLEAAIAFCAAINAAYFLWRALTLEAAPRKLAALVLATLFSGSVAESVFVIAWMRSAEDAGFAPGVWMLIRSVSFAAVACVSALILKVMERDR